MKKVVISGATACVLATTVNAYSLWDCMAAQAKAGLAEAAAFAVCGAAPTSDLCTDALMAYAEASDEVDRACNDC